jgi:hypothetical protein
VSKYFECSFCVMTLCILKLGKKKGAEASSKILVTAYQTTWCHNPQHHNLNTEKVNDNNEMTLSGITLCS